MERVCFFAFPCFASKKSSGLTTGCHLGHFTQFVMHAMHMLHSCEHINKRRNVFICTKVFCVVFTDWILLFALKTQRKYRYCNILCNIRLTELYSTAQRKLWFCLFGQLPFSPLFVKEQFTLLQLLLCFYLFLFPFPFSFFLAGTAGSHIGILCDGFLQWK